MKTKSLRTKLTAWLLLVSLCMTFGPPSGVPLLAATPTGQIEPGAGKWKTWVLKAGNELRPLAPPDQAATRKELVELQALVAKPAAKALEQITYWDAGAPSYRWTQLTIAQLNQKPINVPRANRLLALLHVAIYDAMVAAWDAKYAYNRQHPGELDPKLIVRLANPASPAYPDERAVAAGAAATILTYIYPDDAKTFADLAQAAGQSRLLAGVSFPSDVKAGLDLGRAVAAKVIEHAKADGSDAKWTGTVPTGPDKWKGDKPVEPLMGSWKTWVLKSGDQFRLPPPPAYDSAQKLAELTEIKSYTRTLQTTMAAYYWQTNLGTFSFYDWAHRHIFEQKWEGDPPRAERVYALMSVAKYDAGVACFDTKYTYWAIRPSQLDPTVKPLFPPPPHPSYPSFHGCNSAATAVILAYLFPSDGKEIEASADEAAMSRMWAGIHFRSDDDAGLALGRKVGQLMIAWAKQDGSQ